MAEEKREPYTRIARTHATAPARQPLETRSRRVTVAPIRLPRNISGQSRTGCGPKYP